MIKAPLCQTFLIVMCVVHYQLNLLAVCNAFFYSLIIVLGTAGYTQ